MSAREELISALSEHACCFTEEDAERMVDAFAHELAAQQRTFVRRQGENPLHYGSAHWAMVGVDEAADFIDPYKSAGPEERRSMADIMASVREQVEAQGGTWPLKPPPGFDRAPHEEPTAWTSPRAAA